MAHELRVAEGITLPIDFVAARAAIVGMSGAGKSNALRVMVEAVYDAGAPFVLVDPFGASWGLRSSADGKGEGLRVPIFGGYHGDLPLHASAGALIARELYETDASAVLDLSALSHDESASFVADFNETLFALHLRRKKLRAYFADECSAIAPERPVGDAAFRAVESFARLHQGGRAGGIGLKTAAQGSAEQAKRTMKQCEMFVALRTMAPLDQKPIVDYLRTSVDKAEADSVKGTLSRLHDGEAWFIAPRWLGEVKRARFHLSRTFDSSYTPKLGEVAQEPKVLAPVDLARIRAAIEREQKAAAPAPGRADAGQPASVAEAARLKARVAELEAREPERVEVPVLVPAEVEALAAAAGRLAEVADGIIRALNEATLAEHAAKQARPARPVAAVAPQGREPTERPRAAAAAPRAAEREPRADAAPGDLGGGPMKVLAALAGLPDHRATRRQLGVLAGYSPSAGGFRNNLSVLRQAECIRDAPGSIVELTAIGASRTRGVVAAVTSAELHDLWRSKLDGGPRKLLDELLAVFPRGLSREELAERAGYVASAGGFRNNLSALRTTDLIDERDRLVYASDALFPTGKPR